METRRLFLKKTGLSALTLVMGPAFSHCSKSRTDKRPNIVLILADDMGWSDLGCYGGEVVTPNLDRLATEGIRFTQFHNTAKCFPSRACILTGVYAQQCGMAKTARSKITNAVTLAEVLQGAGYRTLMAGKHHGLDNPYHRGFDRYFGLRDGCCNYFNPGKQREGEEKPAKKREFRTWCIDDQVYQPYTPPEKDFYTTDYFTHYALQYLDEYQNEEQPFFLYLAYTAPHDPLQAWAEDIAKYQDVYRVGYETIRQQRFQRQLEMGLIDDSFPLSEPTFTPWNKLSVEQQAEEAQKMAVYAAMIDRMDQNIGRVLKKLEAIGKLENTLILFASDNGSSAEVVRRGKNVPGTGPIGSMTRWTSLGPDWANVSNTPFRFYKNYSHEGGICTPLIAFWPARISTRGQVCHQVGHFIDFMATFVDITGATYPGEFNGEPVTSLQGVSFLPVLDNQSVDREKPIFWQWSRGRAIRKGPWKMVSWQTDTGKEWELYDMEKDKTETTNVAESYPEVVRELERLYESWEKGWGNEE